MNAPPAGGSFQISQGLEVLAPKSGPAYPIPCGEWDYLKERLGRIVNAPWLFQTLGSLFLGGSLSTLTTIIVGVLPSTSNATVIAWAVVAVLGICGIALLILASQQKRLQAAEVVDVIRQMELIEQRFDRVKTQSLAN